MFSEQYFYPQNGTPKSLTITEPECDSELETKTEFTSTSGLKHSREKIQLRCAIKKDWENKKSQRRMIPRNLMLKYSQ